MTAGKKWISGTVALSMVGLLAACTGTDEAGSSSASPAAADGKVALTGYPIVKEPLSFTFFTGKPAPAVNDWSKLLLWQDYQKRTNINVSFQLNPVDVLGEKRNLALASGDYPEVFYQASVPNLDVMKYGSQGVFIRLNDLINQYAPNFKKLMDTNPQVKKAITMPDGNIYSFPWVFDPSFTSMNMGPRLWLNNDWLTALNMKEPTTVDEFYAYLKAVKERDPNKNGVQDEIPFSSVGLPQLLLRLKGSFGMMKHGSTHQYVDEDPATGKLVLNVYNPGYKEMLQFAAKLYAEGLIDKDIFTQKTADFYAKASKNVYGSLIAGNPRISMNLKGFVGAPAFTGPHGDQSYGMLNPSVPQIGAFIITDKAKDPEALVRWVDYFYSEEGSKNILLGAKDVTYTETADGKYQFKDEITKNPNGLSQDQALAQYTSYPGGGAPSLVLEKFYMGSEGQPDSQEAARKLQPYLVKDVWPQFNYTQEENDRMATLRTDLYNYLVEYETKFVKGTLPFTEWDNFITGLKKVKADEFMALYNAAYERFKKS